MSATGSGIFLVFEGGEGAGKTTQVGLLSHWLSGAGVPVVVTREPGGTALGARLRDLLLDPETDEVSPHAEALLYAADRAQHVASVVRPALGRGAVVISDRYVDSSVAYQGAGRKLAAAEVAELSKWATDGLLPDLVVLLDVDPEAGLRRAAARGADLRVRADRLESEPIEFHRRVREYFLECAAADPRRYLVVDAAAAREVVADAVRSRVDDLLRVRATTVGT